MRSRLWRACIVILLATSCRRASQDGGAYWSRLDALYFEAAQTFSNAYAAPTPESIAHLPSLREEIAQLPHPASANRYQELKLSEIDSGIRVLAARRDNDAANADAANQKLLDTRQAAYDERKRIRPADAK